MGTRSASRSAPPLVAGAVLDDCSTSSATSRHVSAPTGRTARSAAWAVASSARRTAASTSVTCWPPATTWRSDRRRVRARRRGADGSLVLDPSGYVKGWAIEEAAWLLDSAGGRDYWINAGGDIVARGHAERRPAVARRHPASRPGGPGRGRARGLRPGRRDVGRPTSAGRTSPTRGPGGVPSGLRSVTVVGPGLAFTDAYATAVYVMGLDGLRWLATEPEPGLRGLRDHRRRPHGLDRGDGPLPGPRA